MIELISDSELEDAFSDVRPERMDIGKGLPAPKDFPTGLARRFVLLEAYREDSNLGFHTTHATRENTYPGASTHSQCFSCLQPLANVDMGTFSASSPEVRRLFARRNGGQEIGGKEIG
jgi:hypothetical protein